MSSTKTSYIPPRGATIHQLEIKPIFNALEKREKFYAHYLARAAWHGSRIIMRQVSPESPEIFDFIMDLYRVCGGKWDTLTARCNITSEELNSFLEYAAMFLCNLGNYYGEGDQKFVPDLTAESLRRIAGVSLNTETRLDKIIGPLLAIPPFCLGYPSPNAQSGYYPSDEPLTQDEITKVSEVMERKSIGPENTRLRKTTKDGQVVFQVLQASAEIGSPDDGQDELAAGVFLVRGDHSAEMTKALSALEAAKEYAGNGKQAQFLTHCIESFRTGSSEAFQESQKAWVLDISARVENILGFIEPYRDPAGIRAEWEAMIGIADADEVTRLKAFVDSSTIFIRQLPWTVQGVNDGKGPFEKSLFEAPDFTSVHALAVCSSIVFEAANLPNYEYIRETCGFKNIVLANRLSVNNNPNLPCHWVKSSEFQFFKSTTHIVRFLTTAIHELIGHGSGKLLCETEPGSYNFDQQDPPINPLTGKIVTTYYRPGQTWGSVFGKLAGTVEECRAILMSEYLMDNKDLLRIFGFTDDSPITAENRALHQLETPLSLFSLRYLSGMTLTTPAITVLYATYLNIGVDGLQGLEHYNIDDQAWGQVHHQAHFSVLKHLLQDGGGVISITHDSSKKQSLTVHVDPSKIHTHGKPALAQYLCCLHIWRCTADVTACRSFYEPLCAVDGMYMEWREIVVSRPKMKWKFVQPNTLVQGSDVEIKVYEESNEGIIQSWAERDV